MSELPHTSDLVLILFKSSLLKLGDIFDLFLAQETKHFLYFPHW